MILCLRMYRSTYLHRVLDPDWWEFVELNMFEESLCKYAYDFLDNIVDFSQNLNIDYLNNFSVVDSSGRWTEKKVDLP